MRTETVSFASSNLSIKQAKSYAFKSIDSNHRNFQAATTDEETKNTNGDVSPKKRAVTEKYILPALMCFLTVGLFFFGRARQLKVFEEAYSEHNKEKTLLKDSMDAWSKKVMKNCFADEAQTEVFCTAQQVKVKDAKGDDIRGIFVMNKSGKPHLISSKGKYYLRLIASNKIKIIDVTHLIKKGGNKTKEAEILLDWNRHVSMGITDGKNFRLPLRLNESLKSIWASFHTPTKTLSVKADGAKGEDSETSIIDEVLALELLEGT